MSYIAKNGRLYTSGASEALTLLDDKFSVNKSYSKGDSCIYNDYLWKFTSDKPAGEWDSSVVEQCRIMDFVDDINGRLTQLFTFENIQILTEYFTGSVKLLDSRAYREGNHIRMEVRFNLEASLPYTVPLFYIDSKFAPKTKSSLIVGSIDMTKTVISVTGRLDSAGYYVFNQTAIGSLEPGSYYVSIDYSLLA